MTIPEWRHTPGQWAPSLRGRLLSYVLGGLTLLVVAHYVAGYLLLASFKLDAREASPLTIVRYAYYYADTPQVCWRILACATASLALTAGSALLLVWPRPRALHGEARFATSREIVAAGLLTGRGILLGRMRGWSLRNQAYLTLPGQQGVALSAQPRAGKGVGVVVPNLLRWADSVVCVDIKKENWTLTAGYRASIGQATYLFDPLAPDGATHRQNLLDYVGESLEARINDLQLKANMIYPDPPNADPFWMASARSLFLGVGLYIFATPSLPRTLGEVLRQGMADDEEGFTHHWRRIIQGRMRGRYPLPETCVRALSDVIDLAPQSASSIRKTFTSRLELWANPLLDAATAASDFDLRELRRRPMSVYVVVRPKDLHRLQPLLSLFFQQAIAVQTDELPEHNPALKHQVLMLLDEFAALGRIPIIAEASGFLPGYNVRTLLVMQTPAQLREVYGEHGAAILLKTLASRIYFAPKDMAEAEEISRELGDTTVKVKTLSRPVAFDLADGRGRRSRSVNVSEQRRPLLLPQEVRDLGPRRALIFMEGLRPILAEKIRYYEIPSLRRRVLPPPTVARIAPILTRVASTPGACPSTGPAAHEHAVQALPSAAPCVREATPADIEHIDELTLEDFDIDLSRVDFPVKGEGELMSESELVQAAESFLSAMREQ